MAFSDVRPASFPASVAPFVDAEAINYAGGDQTLSTCSRGILITGGSGALKVDMISGATVTLSGLTTGQVYSVCVKKIYQSGSTANGFILR